jgi:plasmid stabilization system protein ParE
MRLTAYLHPDAETELIETVDYLNLAYPRLGNEFLECFLDAVKIIERHPESATLIYEDVRRKVLHKFPYSLIYYRRNDDIQLLAVAHNRRKPGYWTDRK